ncbi:protoglobin domain-containing protein [Devosia sp. XK-2]|uniref:protoglobin domain-containing protein n=1 Tax=Devosia sp. XK-2 TaxID=3126689 RepID=UPI0030CB2B7A
MQDTFQQRLDFVGLGGDVASRLAPISPLIERHIERALQSFNAQVATTPSAARFLYGRDRIETNGEGLAEHWRALAQGRFDNHFAEAAQRMGLRHARIGLEPRWHVGSYASLVDTLVRGIIQDGMAAAVEDRRGTLGLFGRPAPASLRLAVEGISEGLATLLAGVLLDIDLSVSGYVAKLREEGVNGAEAQRQRLRQAVREAGRALELAAEGRKDVSLAAPSDPDLAPLHAGAERLADKVMALVEDLDCSSAALRAVAGQVVDSGRLLLAGGEGQGLVVAGLAERLAEAAATEKDNRPALDALERSLRARSRRRSAARRPAAAARANLMALRAELGELDAFAEQLDALHVSLQLAFAESDADALTGIRTGIGQLAAALRTHRAQSERARDDLVRNVAALEDALEKLAGGAPAEARAAGQATEALGAQAAILEEAAKALEALRDAQAADLGERRMAMDGLREAFADLAATLAPAPDDEHVGISFPAPDQGALAAHWHGG